MYSKKTLFFPFSPGVPWQIKNGKYVIPELPVSLFEDILKKRTAVVAGFGGFLEAFYSLSILESINRVAIGTPRLWCGPSEYHSMVEMNGLAKTADIISPEDLARFPTPIFFDQNDNAYFNYLNNYLTVNAYYLKFGYKDYRPIIKQIIEKSTMKWDSRDMPTLRNFGMPDELEQFLKMHNLHLNGPYVLMFPDGGSQHSVSCLDWDIRQIKSLAAILHQRNIPLVLMTKNISKYAYSQARVLPFRTDFAMYLLKKADAILSEAIDFVLVGGAISDAKLFSLKHKRQYDVEKNLRVIDCNNVIYIREQLSPIEVCDFITKSGLI